MRADAREGGGLSARPSQQPSDPPHMGTAVRTAKTSPASWDAFSDVEAFVDEVLMELESMAADGTRPTRSGPKPPLTGAALRRAITFRDRQRLRTISLTRSGRGHTMTTLYDS